MKLVVNGEEVFMNEFVSDVLRDVIHAVVKNLKGVEIDEIKTGDRLKIDADAGEVEIIT